MIDESMDKEQMAKPAQPDEFRAKPAWQRFIVMVAGVTLNVVLAIVIYIGVSYAWGDSYLPTSKVEWGYDFNEAGHNIGFVDGDKIIEIDGEEILSVSDITTRLLLSDAEREVVIERDGAQQVITIPLESLIELRKSKSYSDLLSLRMPFIIDSVASEGARQLLSGDEVVALNGVSMSGYRGYRTAIESHKGEDITLDVKRGDEVLSLTIPVSEEGRIGVLNRNPFTLETKNYTFWESIPAGFRRAGDTIASYWHQMSLIFQPKTEMYRELGGFVAIGSMFSSVWDWQDFWLKTAFLSVILAVMNILPIPGLDGGHSLFTLFEMVSGRKPSDKFLEVTQYIGMGLLFALLLYANGNDFYRLIFG